jgi:hypothetical protein
MPYDGDKLGSAMPVNRRERQPSPFHFFREAVCILLR